ncbi:ATP-binding protein [Actinacidiphila alni]|uniref:ATP-binding protein n=1 Tax=Actinacidiphila alni TaxID=380248 RepID=UPI00340F3303
MPTLVHRFVLAGGEGEVSLARRKVVDSVRAWGVPLDDETADTVRLVASELITNAVVHGEGPVTVELHHRPGRLVIDVLDDNPTAPSPSWARDDDENGRGLALVECLASRCAWEPAGRGKRVRAEIALPTATPTVRGVARRALVALRPRLGTVDPAAVEPESLSSVVA